MQRRLQLPKLLKMRPLAAGLPATERAMRDLCYPNSSPMSTSKLNPLTPRTALPSQVVKDDEGSLVAAAKAGDISAFETLVGRYERKIFRLAQNITQNREDAEDVMQESFLKSYQHLGEFQGNSRFYTWLVRIAVNQALMKLRKRRPNQVSLDEEIDTGEDTMPREVEDWGPSPEDRYEQSELGQILSSTIAELDPPFRIVFQLRDIEELSTEETAETLGLSIPAVKSRLLRARLKLRQKLNRYFRQGENS
jgi:RNA polymerase sigma-70 factor (ECF subfamily)